MDELRMMSYGNFKTKLRLIIISKILWKYRFIVPKSHGNKECA